MSIKFKYYDILEEYIKIDDKSILYLDNNFSIAEFFENVTITDKIVLKEEKEVMFFYSCLDNDKKKFFNINKYFDCIDVAYNYYTLMSDLFEHNIKIDDIKYENWQEPYLKHIYNIHEIMIDRLKKGRYAPRYLSNYDIKINDIYLNKYSKIVFVNKMYTSKKEKQILDKLNIDIEYHIYTNKQDFDEKELILKSLTIKKVEDKVIKAYNFLDKDIHNLAFTQYLSENMKKDIKIVDIGSDKTCYKEINENLLDYKKEISFNTTKTYKILLYIYNILANTKNNKCLLSTFYDAILDKDFNNFFKLSNETINKIKKMMSYSKKYISKEEVMPIYNMLEDIEKIYVELAKIYENESSVFLEAVTEILSLDDFFPNILKTNDEKVKVLLKYLDEKKIKYVLQDKKFEITIPSLDKHVEELVILNANEIPFRKSNNYILNLTQRQKLGLLNENDFKYVLIYEYIRQIYLSNNTTIYYVLNKEEEKDINSVLNNLLYIFNIKPLQLNYSTDYKIQASKHIYNPNNIIKSSNFLTKTDVLPKKDQDTKDLSLNGYTFYSFYNFPIVYILKKLTKKYDDINFSDNSIELNFLGNIIHKLFEVCIRNKINDINAIRSEKDKLLLQYSDNIKSEYIKIYDFFVLEEMVYSVYKFLKIYDKYNITPEKKIDFVYKGINIQYIMDAFLESEQGNIILDFKTGSISEEHKHQLSGYKIFTQEHLKKNVDKLVLYSIFDSTIINEVNPKFTIDEFNLSIDRFLNLKYYEAVSEIDDYKFKKVIRGYDYESQDN